MLKYATLGLSLEEEGTAIRKWLLAGQTEDGSWTQAPGLPGNLSTTVEAYLALKLLGVSASHSAMERARDFVLSQGGAARVQFYTRLFLATFGLVPWNTIPQMPAELIFMPAWAPFNIYMLSSWSRYTMVPLLLFRHHEPVYPLPNGHSPNNDLLDELWLDPSEKNFPFAPSLWDLFWGKDRDAIKWLCVAGDKLLKKLGGLKRGPQRRLARRRCIDWLLEHQEKEGEWAGIFPPIHTSIWALLLEGFPLEHKAVRLGLEALERLAITDAKGKWLQPSISPCWDTALMATALCDAGLASDPRINQAVEWLRDRQVMVDHGDWRVYSSNSQAGGWSFQYYNTVTPDVDDTATVMMTLIRQNPSAILSDCVLNGVEWILGMQNSDGGWGAFDIQNDAHWLNKTLVSDMDAMIDPSTSDITGRMLECFGLILTNQNGIRPPERFQHRLRASAKAALGFLIRGQESEGEASGSWFGRWGCNYIYGTANVLRGLEFWCRNNPEATRAVIRAITWFKQCQNLDGGWGETYSSYTDSHLAGRGESASAQTSWAVDTMLRYLSPSDPAIKRGIQWLASNQTLKSEHGEGMSWPTHLYAGTGFPKYFYLGYPYYHHYFAIQALSRYLLCLEEEETKTATTLDTADIPSAIATTLGQPDILFMVLGGRTDVDIILSVAKELASYRIRIAAHSKHREVIQEQGFEFSDVGGIPNELFRPRKQPNTPAPIIHSDFPLVRYLHLPFQQFKAMSYHRTAIQPVDAKDPKTVPSLVRPFIPDVVIYTPADTVRDTILSQPDLFQVSTHCVLIPALKADWHHKSTRLLLSGAAATSLIRSKALGWDDLQAQDPIVRNIGRQMDRSSSPTWMKVLCALRVCLSIVFGSITSLITLSLVLFDTVKPAKAVSTRNGNVNLVHQARIDRGRLDLDLITEHMNEDKTNDLDVTLAKIWRARVAGKFHDKFNETE
ncbi:terpenoid cyclases/protein prenyltransferase alpha-alpha toroid [Xylaria venustula]|nr:terpenoid cyclases/protein prenyltransferase alpha-alpha toroid [Xylaria venustula]